MTQVPLPSVTQAVCLWDSGPGSCHKNDTVTHQEAHPSSWRRPTQPASPSKTDDSMTEAQLTYIMLVSRVQHTDLIFVYIAK